MRKLFLLVFIANVALVLGSLAVLPSQVAIHFGQGGSPDSWVPSYVNTLIYLAIEIPLFALLFFSPTLVLRAPPALVSLPYKDYWLRDENKPELRNKLESLFSQFGIATFVLLFVVELLVVHANLTETNRLDELTFYVVFIGFFVYVGYWLLHLYTSLKIPRDAASA